MAIFDAKGHLVSILTYVELIATDPKAESIDLTSLGTLPEAMKNITNSGEKLLALLEIATRFLKAKADGA